MPKENERICFKISMKNRGGIIIFLPISIGGGYTLGIIEEVTEESPMPAALAFPSSFPRRRVSRVGPTRLAQQEDENDSPPTEGMAEGQGWVSRGESFP